MERGEEIEKSQAGKKHILLLANLFLDKTEQEIEANVRGGGEFVHI